MKRLPILFALALTLTGCNGVNKLLGTESQKKEDKDPELYVVSCCQDNDGMNNLTWPSFLPQSHIDLCVRVHTACYENDCQIDGKTYLDMSVDCGKFGYKIGDEYYKGKGY